MYNFFDKLRIEKIEYEDFIILLQFFNALSFIVPMFVIHFPLEHPFHLRNKVTNEVQNSIQGVPWRKIEEAGLISFPKDVYAIKEGKTAPHWDIYPVIREKDGLLFSEETRYYYHPIQFFQLLSIVKAISIHDLFYFKEFIEFYYVRRFELTDQKTKEWKEHIIETNGSVKRFIDDKIKNGRDFHDIHAIILSQNHWLIPETMLLWIKVESLVGCDFIHPDSSIAHMEIRSPARLSSRFIDLNVIYNEDVKWRDNFLNTLSSHFSIQDYDLIKRFKSIVIECAQHDFDGLEEFSDLLTLIDDQKLIKLTGMNSLLVNLLEIGKALETFEKRLGNLFPDSDTETEKEKGQNQFSWSKLKLTFESTQEYYHHLEYLLLEYSLSPKDSHTVLVEGITESIILEPIINWIEHNMHVFLSIGLLKSKSEARHFPFIYKTFQNVHVMVIIDADQEKYLKGRKNEWKGKGIKEDSFHICFPDFVTENFDVQEFIDAVRAWVDKNQEKTARILLSESELQDLKPLLDNRNPEEKFEDLLEDFIKGKKQNPNYKLPKGEFAYHLRDVLVNNYFKKKREIIEVINQFVYQIKGIKLNGV